MKKNKFIIFQVILILNISIVFSQSIQQTTFCKNGLNIHISQLQPTYDTIIVNLPGISSVIDVNFIVDTLTHTWDDQIEMYLLHLSISDSLVSHRGGSGDNFINTVLNDSALLSISQGNAPFRGSFRPEKPLTVFNGLNPNGVWIFKVVDNFGGDDGFIKAWCIQITYASSIGINLVNNNVPEKFSLFQNYPNPFNPVTDIEFSLSQTVNVNLTVFDVLGREITTLVNREMKPGNYNIEFMGMDFPSGIYYYTLFIYNNSVIFKETKKMILLR